METIQRFHPPRVDFTNFAPKHFSWQQEGKIATITLNRPEKMNPITLEAYTELRDTFRDLQYAEDIKTIVITGAGDNFCSGGDVLEIIRPLLDMKHAGNMHGLMSFTRMTCDLVMAMRLCPQPIIAAIDGFCAGAGAAVATASDIRIGTERSKVAFLFTRVGLCGGDMGACNILPRIVGAGRAAELLYTGRVMLGTEAERWGFYNQLSSPETVLSDAKQFANRLANGPTFAHSMTKSCIHQEWSMTIEQALEAETQAQAICMQTKDMERAYDAFAAKRKPEFEGN